MTARTWALVLWWALIGLLVVGHLAGHDFNPGLTELIWRD